MWCLNARSPLRSVSKNPPDMNPISSKLDITRCVAQNKGSAFRDGERHGTQMPKGRLMCVNLGAKPAKKGLFVSHVALDTREVDAILVCSSSDPPSQYPTNFSFSDISPTVCERPRMLTVPKWRVGVSDEARIRPRASVEHLRRVRRRCAK